MLRDVELLGEHVIFEQTEHIIEKVLSFFDGKYSLIKATTHQTTERPHRALYPYAWPRPPPDSCLGPFPSCSCPVYDPRGYIEAHGPCTGRVTITQMGSKK